MGRVMKRIAIFIDGTWNRPDAENPTNVVRLARAVRPQDDQGVKQVVLYSPGVGSGRGCNAFARWLDRVLGGALGWGLTDIIEDVYRQLMFLYEPGDRVMVFGFSRGAFAARSLVGLMRATGIAGRDQLGRLPEAVARYIDRAEATHPTSEASHVFRAELSPEVATRPGEQRWRQVRGLPEGTLFMVDFLGLWDTVKALGLPGFLPFAARFNRQYEFHDARLSSMVRAARHAMSIDEVRATFPAMPWDNLAELNREYGHFVPDYMQQWFAGVHGAVGGGGSRIGLSSITLNWIALGAEEAGLAIDWPELDNVAWEFDPGDPLDNKFGPSGPIGALLSAVKRPREGPAALEEVSMAAIDRFLDADGYRPKALDRVAHLLRGIGPEQRAALRRNRALADNGHTHLPGQRMRPRRTPDGA